MVHILQILVGGCSQQHLEDVQEQCHLVGGLLDLHLRHLAQEHEQRPEQRQPLAPARPLLLARNLLHHLQQPAGLAPPGEQTDKLILRSDLIN